MKKDAYPLPAHINFKCFVLMAACITHEYLVYDRCDFLICELIRLNINEVCLIDGQEDNKVSLHPETASDMFCCSRRSIHKPRRLTLHPLFFLFWHRDSLSECCTGQSWHILSWCPSRLLLNKYFLRKFLTSETVFKILEILIKCRYHLPRFTHLL